jgi:hypothetical protein
MRMVLTIGIKPLKNVEVVRGAPVTALERQATIPMIRESLVWIGADITYHLRNGGHR